MPPEPTPTDAPPADETAQHSGPAAPELPLVVLKFGGTSVATAPRWRGIADIVARHRRAGRRVLLVCSAAGKTSDHLVRLLRAAEADKSETATILDELRHVHLQLAAELEVDGRAVVEPLLVELARRVQGIRLLREASPRSRAAVMAVGELLSTRLGALYLERQGHAAAWLDARELLQSAVTTGIPDTERFLSSTCEFAYDPATAQRVQAAGPVAITQGFIASDDQGETVLLGRGGSDTSAAYLSARLGAAALEIWTDVPGLFTADPRSVPAARHLTVLSYRQAEALSALGARVLHPRCIAPVRLAGIPLFVRSTLDPTLPGTRIGPEPETDGVKAVLTRRHIALVTARRPPRWQSVGFIAEVSACFQRCDLSIDLFAASPAAIQATIDLSAVPEPAERLARLETELAEVCDPSIELDQGCLSVVGSRIHDQLERLGLAFGELAGVSPRLVVHCADDTHVSLVLDPADTPSLARKLHALLVESVAPEQETGVPWSELARRQAPLAAEAR